MGSSKTGFFCRALVIPLRHGAVSHGARAHPRARQERAAAELRHAVLARSEVRRYLLEYLLLPHPVLAVRRRVLRLVVYARHGHPLPHLSVDRDGAKPDDGAVVVRHAEDHAVAREARELPRLEVA